MKRFLLALALILCLPTLSWAPPTGGAGIGMSKWFTGADWWMYPLYSGAGIGIGGSGPGSFNAYVSSAGAIQGASIQAGSDTPITSFTGDGLAVVGGVLKTTGSGTGDMLKSTYDADSNNAIDDTAIPDLQNLSGTIDSTQTGPGIALGSDLASYLPLSGGTMTGALDMGAYGITNTGDLTGVTDIVTKGPWVDVRAYGAVGDGVTDDSAAFIAAAAALPNSGGVIYIPSSDTTYIIDSASVDPGYQTGSDGKTKPIVYQGAGWSTLISDPFGNANWDDSTAVVGSVLRVVSAVDGFSFATTYVRNVTIKDLAIIGPGTGTSVGINFSSTNTYSTGVYLENVGVFNFYKGIVMDNFISNETLRLKLRGDTTGIEIGATDATDTHLFKTTVESCDIGINFISGTGYHFYGGLLQNNTTGINFVGKASGQVNSSSLDGFWYENNTSSFTFGDYAGASTSDLLISNSKQSDAYTLTFPSLTHVNRMVWLNDYFIGITGMTVGTENIPNGLVLIGTEMIGTVTGLENIKSLSLQNSTFGPASVEFKNTTFTGLNAISYASTVDLSWADGEIQQIGNLTGPVTVNVPTDAGVGAHLTVIFRQDAVGGRSVTWAGGVARRGNWSDIGNTANAYSVADLYMFIRDQWLIIQRLPYTTTDEYFFKDGSVTATGAFNLGAYGTTNTGPIAGATTGSFSSTTTLAGPVVMSGIAGTADWYVKLAADGTASIGDPSGGTTYSAGNGLSLTGTEFAAVASTNTVVNANGISVSSAPTFTGTVTAKNYESSADTPKFNADNSTAPTGTYLSVGDIYTLNGEPYVAVDGTTKSAIYREGGTTVADSDIASTIARDTELFAGTFAALTGSASDAQIPDNITISAIPAANVTGSVQDAQIVSTLMRDSEWTAATLTAPGKVELATTTETITGTDATRAVTPDGLTDVIASYQPLDSTLTDLAAAPLTEAESIGDAALPTAGTFNSVAGTTVTAVTTFVSPFGVAVDANAAGELGVDTTDDQLIYYGAGEKVLSANYTHGFSIAGTTFLASPNTIPLPGYTDPITIASIACITDTGSVIIDIQEGTASTYTGGMNVSTSPITCDADSASALTIANPAIAANAYMAARIGTDTGTPTRLTVRWGWSWARQ